jgi:hypothetical protein
VVIVIAPASATATQRVPPPPASGGDDRGTSRRSSAVSSRTAQHADAATASRSAHAWLGRGRVRASEPANGQKGTSAIQTISSAMDAMLRIDDNTIYRRYEADDDDVHNDDQPPREQT